MRITNSMMVSNTIWNMNKSMERLSKAQQRESTQSKIQLPSDDPVVATKAVKYRNYVAKVERYQKNADDAESWQKVTDNALSDLGDALKQLRDLTSQASSGTLSDSDREAIKTESGQLKQQVVEIMNTSYADRYIFAGYNTDKAPYEIVATGLGDKVTYKGQYISLGGPVASSYSTADITAFCSANAGSIYQETGDQAIKYNIGFTSEMAINVEGQDVIGQGTGSNLFDSIDKLLLGLDGATTFQTATIDSSTSPAAVTVQSTTFTLDQVLTDLDNDYDRLLAARADLGARMNYVSMAKDRLSNDCTTYTTLMSNNEDMDTAQATMDVSTAEYVYEASLSVGAKVISKTLVDFLT